MTTSTPRITVLVADDHPFFRDGVTRGLVQSGVIDVVAQAEDGREALEMIREHRPQVALVDYQMPDMDGLAVVHAVIRDDLPTRVLLLSAATDSAISDGERPAVALTEGFQMAFLGGACLMVLAVILAAVMISSRDSREQVEAAKRGEVQPSAAMG